jgi:hypothetical protein
MPCRAIGIISLVVLALAILARCSQHLTGAWRRTYVISAVVALYLDVFVLVVQLLGRVAALKELAPTQTEPPFAVAQLVVMIALIVLGWIAAQKLGIPAATAA